MTDIAKLGYAIDVANVDQATAALNRHADAAKQVAAQAQQTVAVENQARVANDNLARSTENITTRVTSARTAARALANDLLSLGSAGITTSAGLQRVALGLTGIVGGFIGGAIWSAAISGMRALGDATTDYYKEHFTSGPALERALKAQKDAIDAIKEATLSARDALGGGRQVGTGPAFGIQSFGLSEQMRIQAEEKLRQEVLAASRNVPLIGSALQQGGLLPLTPDQQAMQRVEDDLVNLMTRFQTTGMSARTLGEELARLWVRAAGNESLQQGIQGSLDLAKSLIELEENAKKAADQLKYLQEQEALLKNQTPEAQRELFGRLEAGRGVGPTFEETRKFQEEHQKQSLKTMEDLAKEAQQSELTSLRQTLRQLQEVQQGQTSWAQAIIRSRNELELEQVTLGKSAGETARLREEQELLNAAMQAGIPITPAIRAQIDSLAQGYADAADAAEKYKDQIQAMDDVRGAAKGLFSTIASDLKEGKSLTEALTDALSRLADKLIDLGTDLLVQGLFGQQGQPLGGILGQLFGVSPSTAPAVLPALTRSTVAPTVPSVPQGAASQAMTWLQQLIPFAGNVVPGVPNGIGLPGGSPFGGNGIGSFGMFGSAANSNIPMSALTGVQGQIWSFFAAKGLSPAQIAGIMGNIGHESAGFNPWAVGPGGDFGLFQDIGSRKAGLLSAYGPRPSVQQQLEYAWSELQGPERATLARLMAANDVRSATGAFAGFERAPGWSVANPEGISGWANRLKIAQETYAKSVENVAQTAQASASSFAPAFPTALQSVVQTVASPGGLSSLFSSLFSFAPVSGGLYGGGRAAGGTVDPGKWYDVGEEGPERLWMGSRGGVVIPNRQGRSSSRAPFLHMGDTHINIAGSVDQKTLDAMERRLQQNNDEQMRNLEKRIGDINRAYSNQRAA